MRTLLEALLSMCLLSPLPAAAIELSLEENKAERGGVGFVDMQRLFREYPETARAKEAFEAEVASRRLEIQRKKAALSDLQAELARLTVERERLLREALTLPPPQSDAPPAVSTTAVSTTVTQGLIATLPGIQSSTGAAPTPLTVSTEPAVAPVAVSTEPAAALTPAATGQEAAPASAAAQAGVAAERAKDMEGQIAVKQQEIEDFKTAFREFQARVEKELVDMEKRRVQILLGRIYDVVQQVAKEEGVGVVVDKSSILYGQQAVDLTDKLVERLK